ncbi:type I-E CRISPR-associated protein Cse1/CasA [Marinobacter sp. X15-166B]|uniref:type I-E CRISPR-associated protein Cse1/CasA n=1 Tax=Marinobacter sp. X15-166B TaxID=1897620 RepID=UPI00085BD2C4|nr:type I-E CRISPR-associated protein Cse1/CasA [Marinobacter sp. X15-166B]OEY65569.1 type I-E CRISPR-associated protein Cse1/CasA [Marinobacter sp. X15-166B]
MNIVQQAWLPFRLKDGTAQVLPLASIRDPDVIDFALPRADFQGAAYQFAIALLQTAFAPDDEEEWGDRYLESPEEAELQNAFNLVAHAFNVVGDGPLFMQDFETLSDQKPTTVAGLLIEAPGANGIKQNTDHFIKRGVGEQMSLDMAVMALFTLQVNAPAGGVGHRVGLRGGGPLTTLVMPHSETATLWKKLWLNVINREEWGYEDPDFTDGSVFPWLASTQESHKKGSEIYHTDVHPLHMFWAMPRRIRLLVDHSDGQCAISGLPASTIVTSYLAKNYGNNYSGTWEHPLTPYTWDSKKPEQDHLSLKAQPGGINYKTWDVMALTSDKDGQRCAGVVTHYQRNAKEVHKSEQPRLWVFGYDMDNMKARGWYSVTMPLFHVDVDAQDAIVVEIKRLQSLASSALWYTRDQIKAAWFDKPKDAKGDISFIDLAFWQRSESVFFTVVEHITQQAKRGEYINPKQAGDWLNKLRSTCMDLFDEYALSELGDQRSMAKRIKARQALMKWLFGSKDIKRFVEDYKIAGIKEAV